jgi:hypothetical protein
MRRDRFALWTQPLGAAIDFMLVTFRAIETDGLTSAC